MRRTTALLAAIFFLSTSSALAQAQQPFIITLYGGLFFPSNIHHREVYQSNSDLIYGFGIGLPIDRMLVVTGDMSFFKTETMLGQVADSVSKFEERFIHTGLLHKRAFTSTLSLRLSGGFNYITVKQTTTGPQSPEQSVESEKKLGYFGGIGLEHLFEDGRASLFIDALYDYRHLSEGGFNGDYGGVRFVVGVHLYLF
jgi:hypothetical protein